jgi:hypothetical protein
MMTIIFNFSIIIFNFFVMSPQSSLIYLSFLIVRVKLRDEGKDDCLKDALDIENKAKCKFPKSLVLLQKLHGYVIYILN